MNQLQKSTNNPEWLLSVEQNSWQIEIFISGGLLITLYHLPSHINEWMSEVVNDTLLTTGIILIFLMALIITKALLIGFATNLLLRSMWLASLGVHFAFPDGINEDDIDYHENVKKWLSPHEGPHQKVLMLEKWSSLSYSLSIILTIYSTGAMLIVLACYFLLFEPFLPPEIYDNKWFGYSFLALIILFSFGVVDHFLFRKFRDSSGKSLIYYRFTNWLSFINLTKIFKYEWLVLTSHINRWKLYLICFIYFGFALALSLNDITWDNLSIDIQNPLDHRDYTSIEQVAIGIQNKEYLEHYKEGEYINNAIIPSEVVKTSFLPVFLPYDQWYDYGLKNSLAHYDAQWEPDYSDRTFNNTENYYATQRSFNDIHKLSLDLEIIDSLRWYMREHPQSGQLGFHTMVDIDSLDRGGHTLRVYYLQRQDSIELDTILLRRIPFWKE